MDLSEMLIAARANLWKAQERLNCFPRLDIFINDHVFSMSSQGHPVPPGPHWSCSSPCLRCHMSPDLLRRILTRETHWNNAELAGDIEFDRRPNVYLPDVHTLMSFFHV